VFIFITINTIFYINIYKNQQAFQTELLSRQIRICGNTIEQNGLNFENEVNYILYSENIDQLFKETDTKEVGWINLELFYAKYQQLIRKINVYDNQKHVYSLILDNKNNFVSDFYESQQQVPLFDRDKLYTENGNYYFAVPVFKNNIVQSNIIIQIDFIQYIGTVFDQYKIENTLWQWVTTNEGEIVFTFGNDLLIDIRDLEKISEDIMQGNEGSLIHTININGEPFRAVSVYYPTRLISRDLGIVFSIKTNLFLQSIHLKMVIISIVSVILMILILYINFRIIKVKSSEAHSYETSEKALRESINHLPVGLIIINPDQSIRIINKAASELLLLDKEKNYTGKKITQVLHEDLDTQAEQVYHMAFGEGNKFIASNQTHENILFKQEFYTDINKQQIRILVILDITSFEKAKKLNTLAYLAKSDLIKKMSHEIRTPLDEITKTLNSFSTSKISAEQKEHLQTIQRSTDLLENLIAAIIDFSRIEAGEIAFEKIPYRLRNEINLAIEPLKPHASGKNISIITKIRNDVPDKVIGDPFRLRQVISQLLETAIDYTDKGRILLSAELIEHIHNTSRIKFQIEDTGQAISVDLLDQYLTNADYHAPQVDNELGETGLKLFITKQQIEMMRGHLKIESPSSITTNPDFPGMKYSFSIEIIPDEIPGKELNYDSIKELKDIQVLVLNQINEPQNKSLAFLVKSGMNIKQRIYRNDNLDSIVQYIKENASSFHMMIIIDKPDYDGFVLARKLFEEEVTDKLLFLIISSNPLPGNLQRSKDYQVDYYLTEPIESRIFSEIIRDHFKKLPEESMKHLPTGIKINERIEILLVEDNLYNRKVNQALFKSLGFEIDIAKNGDEAIAMVRQKKYDIIFMDLLMPGKDGLETAAELREQGFTMPIIALTAVEKNNTKQQAHQAGINEYLVKPATTEIFRKVLLNYFAESS
jgi:signal transduction histidine kinase/CheY-like chemotaxis protein